MCPHEHKDIVSKSGPGSDGSLLSIFELSFFDIIIQRNNVPKNEAYFSNKVCFSGYIIQSVCVCKFYDCCS